MYCIDCGLASSCTFTVVVALVCVCVCWLQLYIDDLLLLHFCYLSCGWPRLGLLCVTVFLACSYCASVATALISFALLLKQHGTET